MSKATWVGNHPGCRGRTWKDLGDVVAPHFRKPKEGIVLLTNPVVIHMYFRFRIGLGAELTPSGDVLTSRALLLQPTRGRDLVSLTGGQRFATDKVRRPLLMGRWTPASVL